MPPRSATTVTPGTCGNGDSFGFRMRQCDGGGEVYLGQANLGGGQNRAEGDVGCTGNEATPTTYTIECTFTYDPNANEELNLGFDTIAGNDLQLNWALSLLDNPQGSASPISCSNGINF